MNYKKFLCVLIFLFLNNCSIDNVNENKITYDFDKKFVNKGFALIYNDHLYKDKSIQKKMNDRSLSIFQKNLKKDTPVKITNILNNKTLITKVGDNSDYPVFNNSVISPRIASILGLNSNEPYIEIISIPKNSMFIAKSAKTFDEEKQVATKAPVDTISINEINDQKTKNNIKVIKNKKFSYTIKIADFYFNKTALLMSKRIINESNIKNPKIQRLSDNKYRVYLGPFNNINSLQNSFNDINIFEFENIEIIKND
jgi:hypothetical protein